eukprot:scaffold760_cov372-Prasinococcus_capsulatus_cf.AAC.3
MRARLHAGRRSAKGGGEELEQRQPQPGVNTPPLPRSPCPQSQESLTLQHGPAAPCASGLHAPTRLRTCRYCIFQLGDHTDRPGQSMGPHASCGTQSGPRSRHERQRRCREERQRRGTQQGVRQPDGCARERRRALQRAPMVRWPRSRRLYRRAC